MKQNEMIVLGLAGLAVWMIWQSQKNKSGSGSGAGSSVWAPMSGTGFTAGMSLNPFSFVPTPSLQDDDMQGLEDMFPSLKRSTGGASGSW